VVLGFGGAGNDLLTHLMDADLKDIYCVAADTDHYNLQIARAHSKLAIPVENSNDDDSDAARKIGNRVSRELQKVIGDADIVFVLAGMGGGTGGVVAPIVSETARRAGALTVGIVTKPFHSEQVRFRAAIDSIRQMLSACDTVVLIDSHSLDLSSTILPFRFHLDPSGLTCCAVVESITHTFAHSGLSNADLGEFRTMLRRGGLAKAGIGHSHSHLGAEEAALKALRDPLVLGDLLHANGIFVNISGSKRLEHSHLVSTLELLSRQINPNAPLFYGHRVDPKMQGITRVTLVATGVAFPFSWGGYRNVPLEIYELEPESSREEKLSIELGLHQLEAIAD
jgi:cell division protein FtsZ